MKHTCSMCRPPQRPVSQYLGVSLVREIPGGRITIEWDIFRCDDHFYPDHYTVGAVLPTDEGDYTVTELRREVRRMVR